MTKYKVYVPGDIIGSNGMILVENLGIIKNRRKGIFRCKHCNKDLLLLTYTRQHLATV